MEKTRRPYIETDLIAGNDGFYIYWPAGRPGALTAHDLRCIADELDRRNKQWETQLNDYFSEHRT